MSKEKTGPPLTYFLVMGVILGVTLTVIVYSRFVRPVISDKQIRQAQLDTQRRCEDEFAMWPRQRGKNLQQAIEKCRKVAGINAIGGTKR